MSGAGGTHEPGTGHHAAANLAEGAANLVHGCAEVRAGQRVLVVAEDPALGWFDAAAPSAVAEAASRAGADVSVQAAGDPAAGPSPELAAAIAAADVAIYFARLGDQDRFVDLGTDTLRVVSYARTAAALASSFGRTDHDRMIAVKTAVDRAFAGSTEITVTCPLGTCITGPGPAEPEEVRDVSVRRFPLCVPAPVSAAEFSGEVVLAGYLTPTGSRVYEPPCLALEGHVIAEIQRGRIRAFHGAAATVRQIEKHYATVAARFGIDADVVHSWHAGIHDGCTFAGDVGEDPDLWSNTIFGSPRYLHFHTCGDYPPGEICWMVAAPTVVADGRVIWRDGVLAHQSIIGPG